MNCPACDEPLEFGSCNHDYDPYQVYYDLHDWDVKSTSIWRYVSSDWTSSSASSELVLKIPGWIVPLNKERIERLLLLK